VGARRRSIPASHLLATIAEPAAILGVALEGLVPAGTDGDSDAPY